MNIYMKLASIRVALQEMNIKKSGENKFAGYKYYELGDFLPAINKLMMEQKMVSQVSFSNELATLTIINAEKPEEVMTFTSPMAEATLKGAHAIQNLGAVETYQRRYLYMSAFEIVEHDALDSTQGKDAGTTKGAAPTPPTTDNAMSQKQFGFLKGKVKELALKHNMNEEDAIEMLFGKKASWEQIQKLTSKQASTFIKKSEELVKAG